MSPPIRLGILATHPIQYHAPLYRELAARDDIAATVFFCHRPTPHEQGVGFGVDFDWDVDLTSGYPHVWLENVARRPSLTRFTGCDTPGIASCLAERQSPADASTPFDAFVVHGWAWKSCWQAFRACWRTRTPLIVRGDSQLPRVRPGALGRLKHTLKRLVYPTFVRRFDLCLAYGERSTEYFRHYGATRVATSPHFVDNAAIRARADAARGQRAEIRRAQGIPENAFCFLFCGKFIPEKRPLDALLALRATTSGSPSSVSSESPTPVDLHLLMVGDGELRAPSEALAKEEHLPVTFAGFVNQSRIPEFYAAADALLLPSLSETWGLVVNEAMACGLPVIVSDACGCVPDLVAGHDTGLVIPPCDVPALASAMAELPHQAERFGMACASHIRRFSPSTAADALVAAVRGLLDRPVMRTCQDRPADERVS